MPADPIWFPFAVHLELMAKVDLDASSSELLGTEIGPYRLVRRLGMGGMAETFVAIRRGPGGFTQRVCLKLVLPFFREDEEFVSLFQREARLAAKLRHSNIVGVIDFGEIAGRSYIALELVDGVDLQVLLDAESGKRLSPELVALLGHDLAAALDHAHNPPRESDFDGNYGGSIVHRDISPSNVLISRHGEIMLTDFGVAKAVTGSSRKHSAVKGKIPYMSPEQLRLESLDGRADLFGVGVVLYEALCGRRPYEGGHDPATIMLILQGTRQPLASLAPGAPPELCKLIDSLIEPDRENRPESAAALIELLDPFVPSPRVRRQLGKRVAELRPEEDAISGFPPAFGEQDTAQHDNVGAEERKKRTSGIVGAGESQKHVEPWAEGDVSEAQVVEEPPSRSSRKGLAASLLAFVLLAAGGVTWWSTRDGGQEVSQVRVEKEAEAAIAAAPVVESAVAEEPSAEVAGSEDGADEIANAEGPKLASPEGLVGADATRSALGSRTERSEARAKEKSKRSSPTLALPPATLTVVVHPWGDVWINGKSRGPAPLKNVSLKPGRYRISAGQGEQTVTQTIRLRSGEQKKVKLKLDVTK